MLPEQAETLITGLDTVSWQVYADWIEEYPHLHTYDAPVWAAQWRFRAHFVSIALACLCGPPRPIADANGMIPLPGGNLAVIPCRRPKTIIFWLYRLPWDYTRHITYGVLKKNEWERQPRKNLTRIADRFAVWDRPCDPEEKRIQAPCLFPLDNPEKEGRI